MWLYCVKDICLLSTVQVILLFLQLWSSLQSLISRWCSDQDVVEVSVGRHPDCVCSSPYQLTSTELTGPNHTYIHVQNSTKQRPWIPNSNIVFDFAIHTHRVYVSAGIEPCAQYRTNMLLCWKAPLSCSSSAMQQFTTPSYWTRQLRYISVNLTCLLWTYTCCNTLHLYDLLIALENVMHN